MATGIGISGFGITGRLMLERLLDARDVQVVGINDPRHPKELCRLFQQQPGSRVFMGHAEWDDTGLLVNGRHLQVLTDRDSAQVDWTSVGAEIVVETDHKFNRIETLGGDDLSRHLRGGATKVLVTLPPNPMDLRNTKYACVVMGINENRIREETPYVFSLTPTTNSLASLVKPLHDAFGVQCGFVTSIHQSILFDILADGNLIDFYPRRDETERLDAVSIERGSFVAGRVLCSTGDQRTRKSHTSGRSTGRCSRGC